MKTASSINAVEIRLTKERWEHITRNHVELSGFESEVLETIRFPVMVVRGREGELIAVKKLLDIYLVVVYKEERTDGFVITAFLTRRIEQIKKKGVIWTQK